MWLGLLPACVRQGDLGPWTVLSRPLRALLCCAARLPLPRRSDGIMLCDVGEGKWPVVFVNEGWEKVTGIPKDAACGRGFWDLFQVLAAIRPCLACLRCRCRVVWFGCSRDPGIAGVGMGE